MGGWVVYLQALLVAGVGGIEFIDGVALQTGNQAGSGGLANAVERVGGWVGGC